MQRSINNRTNRFVFYFFWLSLLIHLLIFSVTFLNFKSREQEYKQRKQPNDYVPSYIYKGAIKPSFTKQVTENKQDSIKAVKNVEKPSQTAPKLIKEQVKINKDAIPLRKSDKRLPTLMASSLAMLHSNQMQEIARPRDTAEPILLVGDEHEIADPFVKLIGRALSANFRYPELEGRMGIKGRVLVEMTLHPEGYIDDVVIVKSSNNQNLDAAALYAINKAPTIEQAERFIKKPKRFLVGFVFM